MSELDNEKSNQLDLEAQGSVDSTASMSYDFVDYTPPETAKILPPAKYKLSLLISSLVFVAVWLADEADAVEFLNFDGWLSPGAAFFVFLGMTVFVLTYGALDLLVMAFTVRVGDGTGKQKCLGIGAWLKAPRSTWMYRYQNLLVEILAVVIRILEDGFRMFDAPPSPRNVPEVPRSFTPSLKPSTKGEAEGGCQKILKIEHRIDPSKIIEYTKWEERIAKVAREYATGMIKVEKLPYTGKDGKEIEIVGEDGSLLLDAKACKDISTEIGGLLRVIILTFQDIDCLNEWMVSPRKKIMFDELQPFLVVPDVIQIQQDRELPDAFTDIMIRQGESVPVRPPLKWKVWWLTTVGLYISINWVNSFTGHYYEFWDLNEAHIRLQNLVSIPITVFVNVYILVPLLLFVFNHWLKRTEAETKVKKEPWRTLNDGFQSIWWKAILVFAYYGGMAIAWIVHTQAAS